MYNHVQIDASQKSTAMLPNMTRPTSDIQHPTTTASLRASLPNPIAVPPKNTAGPIPSRPIHLASRLAPPPERAQTPAWNSLSNPDRDWLADPAYPPTLTPRRVSQCAAPSPFLDDQRATEWLPGWSRHRGSSTRQSRIMLHQREETLSTTPTPPRPPPRTNRCPLPGKKR